MLDGMKSDHAANTHLDGRVELLLDNRQSDPELLRTIKRTLQTGAMTGKLPPVPLGQAAYLSCVLQTIDFI
ncbi:hypothetical protein [Methylobacterium nodulans]|uniref:hypothetical protein n=1 Tax=Methylobacterium nodulans TaxID=114616 RepID=UPI0005C132D6|nr:hypothetical protein [Methylobacterium nodulans]